MLCNVVKKPEKNFSITIKITANLRIKKITKINKTKTKWILHPQTLSMIKIILKIFIKLIAKDLMFNLLKKVKNILNHHRFKVNKNSNLD